MLLGLEDGSVRVWDVRTSGVVGGWERAHASRVRGMAILKEGEWRGRGRVRAGAGAVMAGWLGVGRLPWPGMAP